eukprot:2028334-Prymnesium_polylepis.1
MGGAEVGGGGVGGANGGGRGAGGNGEGLRAAACSRRRVQSRFDLPMRLRQRLSRVSPSLANASGS